MKPYRLTTKALALDEWGRGIIKVGKVAYAVSNLLPKEEGIIEINEELAYQKAKLIKVTKAVSYRQDPACEVYQKCGGCQLLHMNYDMQTRFKKEYIINAFRAQKMNVKLDEYIGGTLKTAYRNKMQVAYRYRDHRIIYGFYEEESHRITAINACPVQTKSQNAIAAGIAKIMTQMKIPAYNEDKRSGLIRFALIKEAFQTKEILVTIVTQSEIFPGRNDFVRRLRQQFPEITTIVQNINSRQTSIILGEQERVLFGPGFIWEELLGMRFKISSKTFFQINPEQTRNLLQKVIDYGAFQKDEVVLDAYCGVGTIGLVVSPLVKQVIGVEANKQSINNAIENLRENHLDNLQFINEDATEFMEKWLLSKKQVDVVIMDPPRSGSTERFLKALINMQPRSIIYVSCEAQTLARDVKTLSPVYEIKKMAAVDMFVGTYHVETVCVLTNRAGNNK
ncbi:MAG TPA: 23S rRNA (uracil(1939)-C(5))-methyltransferase RlmD [Bacilli bacterium]|nr:MAG: putative RNA methyltransferase [Tenericutes bacterium ADurb.BinA124]HNZ50806.1 23S rRNA (uracil(1939)-C(5))-methyltransferase RlmD [Bacilli bacterium]HPX85001.1 23S rRNA (uracil(1939)-C(5))-methyltransferase RlmD [Bacilli bacterium]